MKKLAKTFLMTLAAVAATGVIAADMNTKIVSFSTSDLFYGDGTPVLDGERFAFCWSGDGEFDGLKADLTPVSDAEKVICIVPLAKDGKVPPTVFLVDDGATDGAYFVFMLDTRATADALAASVSGETVNGVAAVDYKVDATAEVKGQSDVTASTDFNAGTFVATPASLTIATDGDSAIVKAVNLSPVLTYQIKYGTTISELKSADVKFSAEFSKFGGDATIVVPGDKGRFFQLQAK